MKLKEILKAKGNQVETIGPAETIKHAMDKTIKKQIGALVVMERESIEGIITERDISRIVHEKGERAFDLAVSDVMTRRLIVCLPDDDIDMAMALMTNNRFRHIPIIHEKKLIGIISIGDIIKAQVHDLKIENRYLIDYITGKYPA